MQLINTCKFNLLLFSKIVSKNKWNTIKGKIQMKTLIAINKQKEIRDKSDSKNQLLQRLVNGLKVVCSQNFQQDSQSCGKHEEELTPKLVICDFKGRIRDMNDHLSKVNQLSPHFMKSKEWKQIMELSTSNCCLQKNKQIVFCVTTHSPFLSFAKKTKLKKLTYFCIFLNNARSSSPSHLILSKMKILCVCCVYTYIYILYNVYGYIIAVNNENVSKRDKTLFFVSFAPHSRSTKSKSKNKSDRSTSKRRSRSYYRKRHGQRRLCSPSPNSKLPCPICPIRKDKDKDKDKDREKETKDKEYSNKLRRSAQRKDEITKAVLLQTMMEISHLIIPTSSRASNKKN
ncbi:hypothetical protein RFI_32984 [Reticulomyxa filosa]|uniref:Uncharacterized protein n=1 Tax=Reticulomyxa filosa TaxID=46433 RepID=X6LRD1_RETFI|nr:hypothetical protein RFI_32984 [Reticulomyxa filosa]|eukprot:ETO04413.1 hypothetical protein RFI_32984 [Reticulomyxa filosa]